MKQIAFRGIIRPGLFLSVALAAVLAASPAMGFKPQKPIELVVMAGQGGGAGKMSRLFQSIIQKNKFSSQPFLPSYKPGGSGAEALRYLAGKSGDSHTVMMTLNSYFTTPLRQPELNVDIAQFTPVARMAIDTFVLWVNSSTNIMSIQDYAKAVKAKNGAWAMGGTGKAQEDELLTSMLRAQFDLKMTYTPFKGGGEVAKNLAGGHLDSTVNNPSEALQWSDAKKVRPLVAFTEKRLGVLPNVPTFKELGYSGMEYGMQRSFIGPPNMPKDAVAYYVGVFKKLHESKEWKEYTSKKAMFREFLTGDALQKYFLEEREKHRGMLKKIGEL